MKFGGNEITLSKGTSQIAEDFHAGYSIAPLFLSESSLQLLEKIKTVFFHHSSPFPEFDTDVVDKKFDLLQETRKALVLSAKKHFRLP
jgi:hypothetical protein